MFLMVVSVAIFGTLRAQDSSVNHRFVLGLEYGATTSINYSALSAFEDNTDNYSMPTVSFFLGFKNLSTERYYGITMEGMSAHTSQPFEDNCYNYMALLSSRRYLPLFNNVKVWYGYGVGAAWIINQYTVSGDNLNINRLGLAVKFEGGLIYNVTDYSYIGLTGGFVSVPLITDNYDVPAGYTKNNNKLIFGKQIMLSYGVKF